MIDQVAGRVQGEEMRDVSGNPKFVFFPVLVCKLVLIPFVLPILESISPTDELARERLLGENSRKWFSVTGT